MKLLGRLLVQGENGVERDIPRAAELFSSAIVGGNDTDAMYNLASLLSVENEQLERDFSRAVLNRSIQ